MFSRKREQTKLESAVDTAINELNRHDVGSEEYVKALECVTKLHSMKAKDKPDSVKMDTLVLALTNLFGILMVIKHEEIGNVLTSKALGLLLRTRP
jgi:hypothetical protein